MALTGRFTFRRTFSGKIVLQVEEERKAGLFRRASDALKRRFRDATLMDLAMPEMRALIDLRNRPHYMAAHSALAGEPAQAPAIPREVANGVADQTADLGNPVIPLERPRRTAH